MFTLKPISRVWLYLVLLMLLLWQSPQEKQVIKKTTIQFLSTLTLLSLQEKWKLVVQVSLIAKVSNLQLIQTKLSTTHSNLQLMMTSLIRLAFLTHLLALTTTQPILTIMVCLLIMKTASMLEIMQTLSMFQEQILKAQVSHLIQLQTIFLQQKV